MLIIRKRTVSEFDKITICIYIKYFMIKQELLQKRRVETTGMQLNDNLCSPSELLNTSFR